MVAIRTGGQQGGRREGAGRKSKEGKMISIRLSGDALVRLEQLAQELGINKTAVIERLLLSK